MKASLGARKKAEALQLQIEVSSDEEWEGVASRPGLMVVDVYSGWCGPCTSMTHTLRRIKLEMGDDYLTMVTAQADDIAVFENFRMKAEPTWLFFGNGKALRVVHGADGPKLVVTIKELLDIERRIAKGEQLERNVVMLDSLIKPEEVLQPDEDLDDVEGERAARELEEGHDSTPNYLPHAVIFVLPHIVSEDKVEDFLSHMVSAGLVILAHIQQELTVEELSEVLVPPPPPVEEGQDDQEGKAVASPRKSGSGAGGQDTDQQEEENDNKEEQEESDEDLQTWAEELAKAPLYMLLIKVESGDVTESWRDLLGPEDLQLAKEDSPESLVSQFGTEERVLPAWLPKGKNLQKRLVKYAFPSYADIGSHRLLLLPDGDHTQVLESLQESQVTVVSHTQATLTVEHLEKLQGEDKENLQQYVGKVIFAAVLSGDSVSKLPNEIEILYLSGELSPVGDSNQTDGAAEEKDPPEAEVSDTSPESTGPSAADIAIFFPNLSIELSGGIKDTQAALHDDPQTQMQIEKNREKKV